MRRGGVVVGDIEPEKLFQPLPCLERRAGSRRHRFRAGEIAAACAAAVGSRTARPGRPKRGAGCRSSWVGPASVRGGLLVVLAVLLVVLLHLPLLPLLVLVPLLLLLLFLLLLPLLVLMPLLLLVVVLLLLLVV